MNTTQIEFWVGITSTFILPVIAFIIFIFMDKLMEIKQRLQNLVSANGEKDARIVSLSDELTIARARIAELENIVKDASTSQSEMDEVSNFLAERGF